MSKLPFGSPETEFVSCPACSTLHHVRKSRQQVHCSECSAAFDPQTDEIKYRRATNPDFLNV